MMFVVTGASGFIGATLVQALIDAGQAVRALVRKSSDTSRIPAKANIMAGSLEDPGFLSRALQGADVVVHLAGVTRARDRSGYIHGNETLTRRVCQAVLDCKNKPVFVQVSSLAAAGPCAKLPGLDGSETAKPVSLYGESKLAGEMVVREMLQDYRFAVVRPPMVYGPGDIDFLPFFELAKRGWGNAAGGRGIPYSIVYSEDLVQGILLTAQGLMQGSVKTGNVYCFTDGTPTNFHDMTHTAARVFGRSAKVLDIPLWVVKAITAFNGLLMKFGMVTPYLNPDKYREAAQPGWLCTDKKARKELGYEPRFDLEAGMRATVEWYQANGKM